MGKFYVTSIMILAIGIAGQAVATYLQAQKWTAIVFFFGSTFVLMGAACFVLTFGYHVRKTAMGTVKLD